MKHRDVQTISSGPVHVKKEVTLVLDKGVEDAKELRAALAVVGRYRTAAMRAIGWTEKDADWTMVGYAVKNDCVVVVVEQGACG